MDFVSETNIGLKVSKIEVNDSKLLVIFFYFFIEVKLNCLVFIEVFIGGDENLI
jgi:hypothetical protein